MPLPGCRLTDAVFCISIEYPYRSLIFHKEARPISIGRAYFLKAFMTITGKHLDCAASFRHTQIVVHFCFDTDLILCDLKGIWHPDECSICRQESQPFILRGWLLFINILMMSDIDHNNFNFVLVDICKNSVISDTVAPVVFEFTFQCFPVLLMITRVLQILFNPCDNHTLLSFINLRQTFYGPSFVYDLIRHATSPAASSFRYDCKRSRHHFEHRLRKI